jgi:hypothetical protein
MNMKKLFSAAVASMAMLVLPAVHAGTITDTYWGSNPHNYGDVIEAAGTSTYDINGATITRAKSVLTVTISTNFAGKAGSGSWGSNTNQSIGYGDLFLASAWTPHGTDVNHITDNASNGTNWEYGLSLDNRWSNTGGNFKIYSLPNTNSTDILTTNSFLAGSGSTYRDGQAAAVNTASGSGAVDTTFGGKWTVDAAAGTVTFVFDMTGTDMIKFSSFAMHWGETCGNDVIEGITRVVPAPGTIPLLALGLGMIVVLRRRRTANKAGV